MRSLLLVLFAMLLLGGCNQSDNKSVKIFGDAYHKVPTGYSTSATPVVRKTREERDAEREKAIALAKVKSEENLKIAQIEAQTEVNTKKIEAASTKHKVLVDKEVSLESQKAQKEIAFLKEKRLLDIKDKDIYIDQLIIAAVIAIVLLTLIVYYIIQHKKRALQNKLEEEKLRHEEYMQASAQQHEKISRVLGIIADKETDEYVKKELLTILRDQPHEQPLIAYTSPEDQEQTSPDEVAEDQDKEESKRETTVIDIEDISESSNRKKKES